jgi:hypothetical protein
MKGLGNWQSFLHTKEAEVLVATSRGHPKLSSEAAGQKWPDRYKSLVPTAPYPIEPRKFQRADSTWLWALRLIL